MPDIFDEISTAEKRDIFDEVEQPVGPLVQSVSTAMSPDDIQSLIDGDTAELQDLWGSTNLDLGRIMSIHKDTETLLPDASRTDRLPILRDSANALRETPEDLWIGTIRMGANLMSAVKRRAMLFSGVRVAGESPYELVKPTEPMDTTIFGKGQPSVLPRPPLLPGAIAGQAFGAVTRLPDAGQLVLNAKADKLAQAQDRVTIRNSPVTALARMTIQGGAPSVLASAAISALTGDPLIGLAILSETTSGAEYEDLLKAGVSPMKAQVFAELNGAAEAAGEALVFPSFVKGLTKGIPLSKAIVLVAENAGQEGWTGFNQEFAHTYALERQKGTSIKEAAAIAYDAGVRAIPANAIVGGLTAGVLDAASLPASIYDKVRMPTIQDAIDSAEEMGPSESKGIPAGESGTTAGTAPGDTGAANKAIATTEAGATVEGGTATPGQQSPEAAQRAVSAGEPTVRPKELTEPVGLLKYPITSLSDTELDKRLGKASPYYKFYKMEKGFRERERAAAKLNRTPWQSGGARPFEFDETSTNKVGKFRLIDPDDLVQTWISSKGGSLPPSLYGLPETKGVQYVMGRRTKGGTPEVQEVRFSQKQFTETDAARWMAENAGKFGRADVAAAAQERASKPNVSNLEDVEMLRRKALVEASDEIRQNDMYKLAMEGVETQSATGTALASRTIYFGEKDAGDIESYAGEDRRGKVWRQVTFDKTQGQAWDDAAQEAGIGDDFDTFMEWWTNAIESEGKSVINEKALDIALGRGDPELELLSLKRSLLSIPQRGLEGGKGGPDVNRQLKERAIELGQDFDMPPEAVDAMYERVKVKGRYANAVTESDKPTASGQSAPVEAAAGAAGTGPAQQSGEFDFESAAKPEPEQTVEVQPEPDDGIDASATTEPATPIEETEPTGPEFTSARQRMLEQDYRAITGRDGVNSKEKQSMRQWYNEAVKRGIPERENAMRLVAEIQAVPRLLDPVETTGLVIRLAQVKRDHARMRGELANATGEANIASATAVLAEMEAEFEGLYKTLYENGSEAGRRLAVQKLTINKDMDLVSIIARGKATKKAELTTAERGKFETLTNAIAEKDARIAALEKQNAELQVKDTIEKVKGSKRYKKMSSEQLAEDIERKRQKVAELMEAGCYNA